MGEQELDADVIRNKLDAIDRPRTALEGLGEVHTTQLKGDPIVAAAVERLLCRMVELAVETNTHISAVKLGRSPGDYRESFDFAHEAGVLDADIVERIKPSVGMRNAIVHNYVKVDYEIVAAAVPLAIATFAEYRRQVAAFTIRHVKSTG